jgi:hypothetical protein
MFGVGHPRRNDDYMDNLPFVKGNCDFGFKVLGNEFLHLPTLPRTLYYTYFVRIVKDIFVDFQKVTGVFSFIPYLPKSVNYIYSVQFVKGFLVIFRFLMLEMVLSPPRSTLHQRSGTDRGSCQPFHRKFCTRSAGGLRKDCKHNHRLH